MDIGIAIITVIAILLFVVPVVILNKKRNGK
jgi:hypothetical protein